MKRFFIPLFFILFSASSFADTYYVTSTKECNGRYDTLSAVKSCVIGSKGGGRSSSTWYTFTGVYVLASTINANTSKGRNTRIGSFTRDTKFCGSSKAKEQESSARSQCLNGTPVDYEAKYSASCSESDKHVNTSCNYTPIDKGCVGDACGGSGSGGDGSGNGDGNKGEKGDKGDKGDTGEAGKDGVDGINGTNGIDGINGTNGIDGTNGNDGRDGVNGLNGTNGKDGERGAKGAKGEQGLQGIQGKDADPADLSPVLNSISSLKSFNTSEFNSATASRSKISSSLDSISELTSGLGGNIDALKISNKDALSDIKNVTAELGVKSDKQTAYQQIIAEKMALLGDDFGVGIPELDKKAETSNNLLADIKTLTEQNSSVLTAENQAQLDKAFAQFDETKKQTDELLNIKDLTANLGDKNDIGNEKLDSILAAIEALNSELEVTVDNGDVVTAVDKLGNDIAASNNQLGNDITKGLNALGDGIGTLTDSVDGIGDTFDALAEGDFASGTEISCGLTRKCKSYWSSSYPDGLSGVLDAFSERVKSKGFTDVLTIDLGSGSFSPKWDLCFNNIGNMSFGCFELSISDYIWGFIRAIMMFSTVLFCRSAVFGG
ncbi:hypothetical protein [Photobacterium profundum]|uniref:hypothetical protein n=1 Tax=Photobacterium profundum TaxID=74109 RepID=UPI003D13A224